MHFQLQLRVRYSHPARDCRRVLRILPLFRPSQSTSREQLQISPFPSTQFERPDTFGNRRLVIFHREIPQIMSLQFDFDGEVATTPVPFQNEPLAPFKMPSRAVKFSTEIGEFARQYRALPPFQRATFFDTFLYQNLRYDSDTDDKPLDSGAVWTRKWGNCADFAHVFLALCRSSGLAARYVAGFGATEGALHAWCEVLVENHWHAYDPTHGRAGGGLAVATGRDFYDCAPLQAQSRGRGRTNVEMYCTSG